MRAAIVAKQKLLRAWGIRYKDAIRPRAIKEAMHEMADAIEKADVALATLPAIDLNKPDDQKSVSDLLNEGLHEGLLLGRNICRKVNTHLAQLDEAGLMLSPEDVKVLNLGSQTAGWTVRAGVRIADNEFRARRDDVLVNLLEQINAARGEAPEK